MRLRERPLLAVQGSTESDRDACGHAVNPRYRSYRNGLPIVPYEWRTRVYPWAVAAIAAAEARYGPPRPACGTCHAPLTHNGGYYHCARCRRGGLA